MSKRFTDSSSVRKIVQRSTTRHNIALQDTFRLLLRHDASAYSDGYITAASDMLDAVLATVDSETATRVLAAFETIVQERRVQHA